MIRAIAAVATALIWTALSMAPASAADKVVLMLNWYVYGEHAPFYYGKAKGIYAAEGIDLDRRRRRLRDDLQPPSGLGSRNRRDRRRILRADVTAPACNRSLVWRPGRTG